MTRVHTSPVIVHLPEPVYQSEISVEEALLKRRSVRDYKEGPLQLNEISQLLWAAQGITSEKEGGRSAPSAGALYPLELYVVSGNINTLTAGVYHYRPPGHLLEQIAEGDKRKLLNAASLMQGAMNQSAAVIIITAVYKRTTRKYLERGKRYVYMEAGHTAQNIYLQSVSLKIGTVVTGAFMGSLVKRVLSLPDDEEPLYLMPVGKI
ncbi:MAG: SagB/ThcOx family dehydrogenase [Bacteroidota bacterium]|nr:SagB/ThcOx family dehydrogenase [Bacteroidota bacterium]